MSNADDNQEPDPELERLLREEEQIEEEYEQHQERVEIEKQAERLLAMSVIAEQFAETGVTPGQLMEAISLHGSMLLITKEWAEGQIEQFEGMGDPDWVAKSALDCLQRLQEAMALAYADSPMMNNDTVLKFIYRLYWGQEWQ